MIKLTDNLVLVGAKLRSHKIRTLLTILLPGLLFGVLLTGSLIVTGALQSVETFRKDGLTSRYIVNVNSAMNDPNALSKVLRDSGLITKAKQRYQDIVTKKTAEAKRLGITYLQASDQPPYAIGVNGEEKLTLNDPNGITYTLLKEKYSTSRAFDDNKLNSLAKRYRAIDTFSSTNDTILQNSSLTMLKDGKEVFYDESNDAELNANYKAPIVEGTQMTRAPSQITSPFMLPDSGGWGPDGNTLPIILPQNRIEQLLGLDALDTSATTEQKAKRIEIVKAQAPSLTFQMCYRNGASKSLVQQTLQQQKEIKANQNNKDYQKPTQIYTLPDPTRCQNPTVATDTRTTPEKKMDESQQVFDKEFGLHEEPKSYFVLFKIVGVSPAEAVQDPQADNQGAPQITSLNDAIDTLLLTSGVGQVIPESLYAQIPDKSNYTDLFTYRPTYFFGNEDNRQRYIEFANAEDAQRFIDEQSCTTQRDNTCKPAGRLYTASLAFSNSAGIDDIHEKAEGWFGYMLMGVSALAILIMWVMIGRTMTDSRHETAVFRAIGFKRIDIAQIYLLYTVLLTAFVALVSCINAFVISYLINHQYASSLTTQAQYAFGDLSKDKAVILIGLNQEQIIWILGAIAISGLIAIIAPLLRNVRRSPLRDMREE